MSRFLTVCLAAIVAAPLSSGCSLLVHFDRSEIGDDAGLDGGVRPDAGDAGPTLDARTDGGDPCAGDSRIGMACDLASSPCEVGEYACVSGSVECMGTGAPRPATDVCRPAAGDCDEEETCDGTSLACPAADDFLAAGTECRADAGECDVAETCNGTSADCPADVFEPVGTVCAAGFCDPTGTCSATCTPGAACPRAGMPCELGMVDCSGATPTCVAAGPAPATTECRAAAGLCDVAETCDGTTTACPADDLEAAGVECRASAGDCDPAEVCTGSDVTCPDDDLEPATVECRASADDCDVAETCTGTGAACPPDALEPATTTCRASAGLCDVAESCTGTDAACPVDAVAAAGAECRASAGDCDVAETCDGAATSCPANGFAAAGSSCSPPTAGECPGGSATCGCAAPLLDCSGACTDVTSSATHCGACGDPCMASEHCAASVCVGEGNLSVTATWSRAGNGDLLVTTPTPNTIWSGNLGPSAGTDFGEMDRADSAGTGPENVFWDTGATPPSGTYHVCFETTSFAPAPAAGTPVTVTVVVRRPAMSPLTLMATMSAPTMTYGNCAPAHDSFVGSFTMP